MQPTGRHSVGSSDVPTLFEYLGESEKGGTIAVGKQGDLLLVDGNPLEDVAAAAKISGVPVRGRWIDRKLLDEKLRELAAAAEQ